MAAAKRVRNRACTNSECEMFGKMDQGNIRLHGFSPLKRGKRRRYRCTRCGTTFSSTTNTAYYRLKSSRNKVDMACQLSVEGMNISAISRALHKSWNTIERWLERAREFCKQFLDLHMRGYKLYELQADELKTFVLRRKKKNWLLVLLEVCSRLWLRHRVGGRTYRNIRALFEKVFEYGEFIGRILITTDGFAPYGWVLIRRYQTVCLYGQVVKKRKKNRITRVERKNVIGTRREINRALEESEDSDRLNTSFIERLNFTIRQGNAYLQRQSPAHAHQIENLEKQLDLQQCYYNFLRPHMSLRFGTEIHTPAMVAGLAKRVLNWRDILEGKKFVLFFFVRVPLYADSAIYADSTNDIS